MPTHKLGKYHVSHLPQTSMEHTTWQTVPKEFGKCVLFWAQEHFPEKDSRKFANTQTFYIHNIFCWQRVNYISTCILCCPSFENTLFPCGLLCHYMQVWQEDTTWFLTWTIIIIAFRPHLNHSCFITSLVCINRSSYSISSDSGRLTFLKETTGSTKWLGVTTGKLYQALPHWMVFMRHL